VTPVSTRAASRCWGRISVLPPVGAALIGMTAGETFHWTDGDGRARGVRVLTIDVQAFTRRAGLA